MLIFICPIFQLLRHRLFASRRRMPFIFTAKANLSLTRRALDHLDVAILRPHMCVAACLRTPPDQGITIQTLFLFEALVFGVKFFRVRPCENFLYF